MNLRLTSKIIMAALCLSFAAIAQGQEFKDHKTGITYFAHPEEFSPFPDSIRVEFPDQKSLLVFQFKNVAKDISALGNFQTRLKEWLVQIASATTELSIPHRATITIKEKGENEIAVEKPATSVIHIRSDKNSITELLPPGWEINVSSKEMIVFVYGQSFKDLETVAAMSFDVVQATIKAEIDKEPLWRKGLKARMIIQDQKVTYSDMKRRMSLDFIELSASGGLGFLGDKFYPGLDLDLSLRFSNRYKRNNHKVSLLYQNLFFAERKEAGGYSNFTNSFISLAWSKNLNQKGRPQWIGLGAGYLINKTGDYFTGKTAKFFITETVGNFTISPEVYLTNDFKDFQMGIRLNYTF